jgi:putative sterol carrier protein
MIDVKQFLFSLPEKVAPEAVEGLSTLFQFDVTDEGQYTVKLDNGKFEVSEGFSGEPNCKVTASSETLSKLLSRDLNPMMAMMTGKLKISNPGEMLKYAKIFGLM